MKTLKDLGDLKGKRVLSALISNVPPDGAIAMMAVSVQLPTINELCAAMAQRSIMARILGVPRGEQSQTLSGACGCTAQRASWRPPVTLAHVTYGEDARTKVGS